MNMVIRGPCAQHAVGGNLCAIVPHGGGDGLRTRRDIRSQCELESAGQRISRWRAWRVRRTDAEGADSLCPAALVVVIRNDDLRRTAKRGCGCRSRAAVVDDGRDAWEKGVHVDLADGEAAGPVVHE
jgi:hypothetical protein